MENLNKMPNSLYILYLLFVYICVLLLNKSHTYIIDECKTIKLFNSSFS